MTEIRRSVPDDAGRIEEIEALSFSDPWSRKDIFSYICDPTGMCFSVLADGVVVSYLIGRLIAPEGEIYRIATHPDARKRGYGSRLLSYALKTERGRGLETTFLEVRRNNLTALSLYYSFGFEKIGVRNGYYKNPDDDAVIMIYK